MSPRFLPLLGALITFPLAARAQAAADLAPSSFKSSLAASVSDSLANAPAASVSLGSASLGRSSPGSNSSLSKFASGTGNLIFLGAGTLLPLIEDGPNGKEHAIRTADALLTSTLITEALKRITHEKRPDGSNYESFPSGHATAAFAVATMQSHYHPRQAIGWYLGASAIAYSRVDLNRHYYSDVIAGAAVGYLTAQFELKRPRGLILFPFIHGRDQGGGSGVSVSKSF